MSKFKKIMVAVGLIISIITGPTYANMTVTDFQGSFKTSCKYCEVSLYSNDGYHLTKDIQQLQCKCLDKNGSLNFTTIPIVNLPNKCKKLANCEGVLTCNDNCSAANKRDSIKTINLLKQQAESKAKEIDTKQKNEAAQAQIHAQAQQKELVKFPSISEITLEDKQQGYAGGVQLTLYPQGEKSVNLGGVDEKKTSVFILRKTHLNNARTFDVQVKYGSDPQGAWCRNLSVSKKYVIQADASYNDREMISVTHTSCTAKEKP